MKIVVKSRLTEKGIIVLEFDNGDSKEYRAIRAGISWPLIAENIPAYYCMYGEEWLEESRFQGQESRRGRLFFLCEWEAPNIHTSLTNFFTGLSDATALYHCTTLYTVTEDFRGEDYRGYVEAFQTFAREKRAVGRLEEAPWHERPDLGTHHILGWKDKGLLEIPENSLIRAQLQTLQADKVKTVPETLNAVNALRFVVCGFEKYKPYPPTKDRRKNQKGTWMTA